MGKMSLTIVVAHFLPQGNFQMLTGMHSCQTKVVGSEVEILKQKNKFQRMYFSILWYSFLI